MEKKNKFDEALNSFETNVVNKKLTLGIGYMQDGNRAELSYYYPIGKIERLKMEFVNMLKKFSACKRSDILNAFRSSDNNRYKENKLLDDALSKFAKIYHLDHFNELNVRDFAKATKETIYKICKGIGQVN